MRTRSDPVIGWRVGTSRRMTVVEGCKGVEGVKGVELLRSRAEHYLYRSSCRRGSMRAVVCRNSGKGFEAFKGFELLGSWVEQILHVHRFGREASLPGLERLSLPNRRPLRGYPARRAGSGGEVLIPLARNYPQPDPLPARRAGRGGIGGAWGAFSDYCQPGSGSGSVQDRTIRAACRPSQEKAMRAGDTRWPARAVAFPASV